MNIPVSDLPVGDDNGLDYAVEIESQKKLDESKQILKQHLGDNWKVIMFFMVLFIFGLIVLILYGIDLGPSPTITPSDNPPSFFSKISEAVKPHLKIFFIIIIVSIVFLTIWYVVKPEKDTTIYGVVPFPTDRPYVPPDSTSCGTGIVSCAPGNDDCSSACTEKNGNNLYQCTTIDSSKKVYYLGTPLQPGQSYCLPKQNIQNLTNCSTYTGKAVFTSATSGEGWECQCLYPDLFGGDSCDEQLACSTKEDGPGKLVGQVGGKKVYWDPQSMDPSVIDMTPYDRDSNNKPIFTCECPKGKYKYNVYPNDPYVCHADECYSGEANSPAATFDVDKMQCVCDGGATFNPDRSVIKSNISGFCYPYGNTLCNPHPVSGQCTYGLDPFKSDGTPIMFLMDSIPYISYNFTDPSSSLNKYSILVDLSSYPSGAPNPQVNISNTLFKDTFRAFPIQKFSDLSEADQGAVEGFINNDGTTASIISSVIQAGNTPGYTKYCNSYFYDRPNYPACVDQLSKTGNDFVQTCKTKPVSGDAECGGPVDNPYGQCQTDITNTNTGRYCKCNPGNYKNDPVTGQCETCVASGQMEPNSGSNRQLCCSDNDKESGSGPFGNYICCATTGTPCTPGPSGDNMCCSGCSYMDGVCN